MEPLISVIIPIYNVDKYLRRSVESVRTQTYQNLEIILINDGSTDQCGQICSAMAQEDKRIVVIEKEYGGVADARNAGVAAAHGEYIVFVDSDDYVTGNMIKMLYDRLIRDEADLALCNLKFVNEKNEICKDSVEILDGIWDEGRYWQEYYEGSRVFCSVLWNKLYKAELLKNVRFPKGRLHEDEAVLFDIIHQCGKISVMKETGYFYLQRKNSIMGKKNPVRDFDAADAYLKRAVKFYEIKEIKLAETTLIRSITYIIRVYLNVDMTVSENLQKYHTAKEMYDKAYKMISGAGASMRFKINGFTFLMGPRCYMLTHRKRMKSVVGDDKRK